MLLIECTYNAACHTGGIFAGITIGQILIATFLSILFLQSGLDKVFNYQSELTWTTQHFSTSPLKKIVKLLFIKLIFLELFTGVVNVAAILFVFVGCSSCWFYWGSVLSCISLLALFFGQRIAKDYAGAASLVSYFILSVIGLILCF